MSEPGVAHPAAALRRARRAAGLSQEALAELAKVSVRTVRGLETGRTRNPHRHSLVRVAAALAMPEAQARTFIAGWGSAGSAMSFAELVGAGADVDTLLANLATSAATEYLDVSVTEKLTVGPHRRAMWNDNLVAMRALHDGIDRRIVLWGRDPQQDVARVRLDHARNCTPAAPVPLPDVDLVAFELGFGRPIARDDTHVFSYRFDVTDAFIDAAGPVYTTDAVHGFRRGIQNYVLQVEFDGCEPPVRIWQVSGDDRQRERALTIDAYSTAHITCHDVGPGVYGIAWEWD